MVGSMERLEVELIGAEIVVTKPGTDFWIAYAKPLDEPQLVMTRSWIPPTTSSPTIAEFRAQAREVANDKARELGWIV
jgi:hypothetical protein